MSLELTAAESKLLSAAILEMNTIPEIDFDAVAQRVGIKYAKNARRSFKKVWDKLKTINGNASNDNGATNGEDAEDGSDEAMNVESPMKAAPKKASTVKKAPAAKKSVGKDTVPKKASAGGPKPKAAPRQTKKQKDAEAAAEAVAAEAIAEGNEDEDMEENEDGKSHNSTHSIRHPSTGGVTVEHAEPTVSSPLISCLAPVLPPELDYVARTPSPDIDSGEVSFVECPLPMNDEYEAYIRGISLQEWLTLKAENNDAVNIVEIV